MLVVAEGWTVTVTAVALADEELWPVSAAPGVVVLDAGDEDPVVVVAVTDKTFPAPLHNVASCE